MAKLKTQRIIVREDGAHSGPETIALNFNLDISVDQAGQFTAYLPVEIAAKLEEHGVVLNTGKQRNSRNGFFTGPTLDNLLSQVKEKCHEFVSRALIAETIVIQYILETGCFYVKDKDAAFFPNGSFVRDYQEHGGWQNGTLHVSATQPVPFGFRVWTHPAFKRTYKYKSGKIKTFFETIDRHSDINFENKPNLEWLSGVVGNGKCNGSIMEINYTEESAEFFVSIYKAIFGVNERMMNMVTPDKIQLLIDSKLKMIG